MPVSTYSTRRLALHALYEQVRQIREGASDPAGIPDIWQALRTQHSEDWLCALEILEILKDRHLYGDLQDAIAGHLQQVKSQKQELKNLIEDGLKTMDEISVLPGNTST